MGISTERHGIVDCNTLVDNIIADMLLGGFTQVFPAAPYSPSVDKKAVLEAGPTVDPLNATQPWRICIEAVSDFQVRVNVATPIQLTNTGVVPTLIGVNTGTVGFLGAPGAQETNFIHRDKAANSISATNQASYPMSYRLTTCEHGFALFVWYEASDSVGNQFSWVCVQRSVDPTTGEVYVTGKAPVYCAYSYAGTLSKFIVREADVFKPTPSVPADSDTDDSKAIFNAANQVAITEDNKYIVTFPNGLNTPRCAYTHELDIIGTTSADVVSQWAEVPLTVYGETNPRKYKAMSANGANNTGMRLLMLMSGPSTTAQ